MSLHLEKGQHIEFQLPFEACADGVYDAKGREVCRVSTICSPQEAGRIAKLFAASYQAFTMLNGVKSFIYASVKDQEGFKHGDPDEDKEACILCAIDEFNQSVFAESPSQDAQIIT